MSIRASPSRDQPVRSASFSPSSSASSFSLSREEAAEGPVVEIGLGCSLAGVRNAISRRNRSTTTLLPSSALRRAQSWPHSNSHSTTHHRKGTVSSPSQQQASLQIRGPSLSRGARAACARHTIHSFQQYPAAAAAFACVASSQVVRPSEQQQQRRRRQKPPCSSHVPSARPTMSAVHRHQASGTAVPTCQQLSPHPLLPDSASCCHLSYGRSAEVTETFSATSLKLANRKMG